MTTGPTMPIIAPIIKITIKYANTAEILRCFFSVPKCRLKKSLTLRTSGLRASAKKIEIPIMTSPVRALYKKKITPIMPSGTSQNLINVLISVSTTLDIDLLIE